MIWMTDGRALLSAKEAEAVMALLEASIQVVEVTGAEQRQSENVVEVRLLEAAQRCIDAGVARTQEGNVHDANVPRTK